MTEQCDSREVVPHGNRNALNLCIFDMKSITRVDSIPLRFGI